MFQVNPQICSEMLYRNVYRICPKPLMPLPPQNLSIFFSYSLQLQLAILITRFNSVPYLWRSIALSHSSPCGTLRHYLTGVASALVLLAAALLALGRPLAAELNTNIHFFRWQVYPASQMCCNASFTSTQGSASILPNNTSSLKKHSAPFKPPKTASITRRKHA